MLLDLKIFTTKIVLVDVDPWVLPSVYGVEIVRVGAW